MNQSRVEFYKGHDGLWYWRFRAANGRIIADGAQGYTRLESARNGYVSMSRTIYVGEDVEVIEP